MSLLTERIRPAAAWQRASHGRSVVIARSGPLTCEASRTLNAPGCLSTIL